MKRMSFSMTTAQFLDGTKTVTRRLGWLKARAGDEIMGIEKGMGLKKGEKQVKLGGAVITSTRRERLDAITAEDCAREGFPAMSPSEFVAMFCKAGGCKPGTLVTRIEFISERHGPALERPRWMTEQLELPVLPVADPAFEAAAELARFELALMSAVAQTLHTDGHAPTTRSITEHLLMGPETPAGLDGPEFARVRAGLESLAARGLLVGTEGEPGYFGRDDEVTVTRWNRPT